MRLPSAVLATLVATAGLVAIPANPVGAVPATARVTTFPWTIPSGVEIVRIAARGGQGGAGEGPSAGAGGLGGGTFSTWAFPAGTEIDASVGADGASGATGGQGGASGFSASTGGAGARPISSYGGGGGGATLMRYRASGASTWNELLTLGGGGGGGATYGDPTGIGAGGNGGNGAYGTFGGGGAGEPGYVDSDYTPGGVSNGSSGASGADGVAGGFAGGGGGGAGSQGGGAGQTASRVIPTATDVAAAAGGGAGGSSSVDTTYVVLTQVETLSLGSSGFAVIDYVDFLTTALSTGVAGTAYSQDIDAVFGTSGQVDTFGISPTLPSGLSLDTSTGIISGTPAAASSGTYTVTATAHDAYANVVGRTTKAFTLTVGSPSSPAITSVTPGTGPVAGGISVIISGTNLSGASSVSFGTAPATIVTNSATSITATLPTGYGTVDVSVTTGGGTATKSNAFTYGSPTITSIAPSSGPAVGGTSVYVNGTNLTYATGVTFAGAAGTITNVTDTRVTVLTPSVSTTGAVDVVVSASGPASATSTGGFTYTAAAPTAPTAVAAVANVEAADVSWTPGLTGGQPVTFTATSTPGGLVCSTTGNGCTVTGLTGGTSYTFRVVATNGTGSSSSSAPSAAVTPTAATAPGAPTSVSAVAASGQATVSWTPPASTGGRPIIDYTVTSSPGSRTCTTATTSCLVTGLVNGTAYTFTVTARNSVGSSSASSPSSAVTPSAGGGGGGGGSGGGDAAPQPAPSPTTPTAATPVTSPSGAPVAAQIPGLVLPTRIKAPGTTVLVASTLRTADGVRVRARATVRELSGRNLGPETAKRSARIVYGPKGRVAVVNSGRRPIVVTLRLTAPSTATSLPLNEVRRWSVRATTRSG